MKKELIDNSSFIADQNEKEVFKQNARLIAIEKAVIISRDRTSDVDIVTTDAEKIYQWLIKDL